MKELQTLRSTAPTTAVLGALATLLTVGASSCGNAGADITASGEGGPPGGPVLVPDFLLRQDILPGLIADALAVDLDGDGLIDLVESNYVPGSLRFAFGAPDGTFFEPFAPIPTDNAAWRLGAGDFDGDGLTDVAVAVVDVPGGGLSGLQVLLQGPLGEFNTSLSLPLARDPLDIAVVSFLGAPLGGVAAGDEIYLTESGAGVVQRVGLVGGALEILESLDSDVLGPMRPLTVEAIDVEGDGDLDLAVGEIEIDQPCVPGEPCGANGRVVVYTNIAGPLMAPSFLAPEIVLPLARGPVVEAVGDLDGNGFDDLGLAQILDPNVVVLYGDDQGLSTMQEIDFGGGTSSVIFGDLDGDGRTDVAATLLFEFALGSTLSTGPQTFGQIQRYNVGPIPRAIGVFGLPGDSFADVICTSTEDVNVLTGLGGGALRAARGFPVGSQPAFSRSGDLDGDGDPDVVLIDVFQQQVTFMENDGTGAFTKAAEVPMVPTLSEQPGSLELADLDGDGLPEVFVAIFETAELRILRNPGTIADFAPPLPGDVYPVGSDLLGMALGDVNGDTLLDVVVASSGDDTLRVLLGQADETFVETTPTALGFSPGALLGADLNGDGLSDLAASGSDPALAPIFAVLSGDGTGSFSTEATFAVDSLSAVIRMGDLDEDGLEDLVIGQPMSIHDEVFLFLNQGEFAFASQMVAVGAGPAAVSVFDIDNDGHLDLVVPTGEGELRFAFGDGMGVFDPIEPPGVGRLPVPFGTSVFDLVDVDGDALADLVMATARGPHLWIAINASTEAVLP